MAIACPECGTLLSFPPLPRRSTAVCLRCRTQIETTIGRSLDATLLCAIATLVLLPTVYTLPLLRADLLGQRSQNSVMAGIAQLCSTTGSRSPASARSSSSSCPLCAWVF